MSYWIGIGANLIFGLGHLVYTFFYFDALNEPSLWFFSCGLAVVFNIGLNILCVKECDELNYAMAMAANVILVLFSVVLAVVVTETQTVGFAVVSFYMCVVCYNYARKFRDCKNLPA